MLENIINGSEKSDIILIEDSCEAHGDLLMKATICSLCQRLDKVHLFLLEYSPQKLLEGIPDDVTGNLTIHDIASDPLGWDGPASITMETDFSEYAPAIDPGSGSVGVVFDCLSNLILHRSPAYTCQVLYRTATRLSTDGREMQVVAMVHKGYHDDTVLRMLEYTASCVLDLGPSLDTTYHGSCHILHKRSSGKVVRLREQFRITPAYGLADVVEIRMTDDSGARADPGVDPAANLTFNLSLTEQAKDARSKLILPYMHKGEKLCNPSTSGSAKIFYQPDDADDFDEEDPDDDLDI